MKIYVTPMNIIPTPTNTLICYPYKGKIHWIRWQCTYTTAKYSQRLYSDLTNGAVPRTVYFKAPTIQTVLYETLPSQPPTRPK